MTDERFTDTMTLGAAREQLRHLASDGATCPLCTQLVKVYKRPLTSVAARAVAALYAERHLEFGHMPAIARQRLSDVSHQGGYLTLGQHWGLIESERTVRAGAAAAAGRGRTGFWRVTPRGESWLLGHTQIPMYAHLYDGRCLRLSGARVGREDVFEQGFDFDALMAESGGTADGIGAAEAA